MSDDLNPSQPRQIFTRKVIVVVLIFLVSLVAAGWLVKVAHKSLVTSQIIVSTNSPSNTITIIESTADGITNSNKARTSPQTLKNGKAASLPPGAYTVTVQNGSNSVAKEVQIKARQTSRYTINLEGKPSSPEPVASVNTSSFSIDSSQLYFIDKRENNLYKIDSSNSLVQLNGLKFSRVYWGTAPFGVAVDSVGSIYTINGGQVTPLALYPRTSSEPPLLTIAPNNDIYVVIDKTIYRRAGSSDFTQIYTAPVTPVAIAASNNQLAMVTEAGVEGDTRGLVTMTIVDPSGKVVTSKNIDASGVAWSKSGKYLLATSESGSQILDSSLHQIATVPNSNYSGNVWLDDTTLLYSAGSQLWQYSLSDHQARVIASLQKDQAMENIMLNPDGSYVYIAVTNTGGGSNNLGLFRVGLKGQAVSSASILANQHLPWLVDGCFLSLVNFTGPTIEVFQSHPYDGCVDVANKYIDKQGINSGAFTFQTTDVLIPLPIQ